MRDLPRWIIGDCPHTGREIAVFLGSDACPPFAVEFMPRRDPACLIAAWCAANNAAHVDHAETLREILDNIEDKNAGQN